jgi:hypothetical protein
LPYPSRLFTPDDDAKILYLFEVQNYSQYALASSYNVSRGAILKALIRARKLRVHVIEDKEYAEEELRLIATLTKKHLATVDPIYTHYEKTIETDKPVVILNAGCFQTGGRFTFEEGIQEHFNKGIADGFWFMLYGDDLEGFMSGSFAGTKSVHDQALPLALQEKLFYLYLDKIKDRCLGGMAGQHPAQWFEKRIHYNPLKRAYMERGIPYFDGQVYYKLNIGNQRSGYQEYYLALAHEFPGSSQFNPTHPQRRALWQRYPNADVVAMADRHQYAITEFGVYGNEVEMGNRQSNNVWLLQIGTTKTGADPYSIRGWEKGYFGWPYLVLFPDDHRVYATFDYNIAAYLRDSN